MTRPVLCVIDHFGSGGAQRQLVELACGLQQRGHEVHVFVYHPAHRFFRQRVDQAGIRVFAVQKTSAFSPGTVWHLRRLIDAHRYQAVVAFLDMPSMYAELACRVSRTRPRLVVSERSHHVHGRQGAIGWLRRLLHVAADAIVANSWHHAQWLGRSALLRDKVRCIYNGFDVVRLDMAPPRPPAANDLRLLAIGRVGPEKNALVLVQALIVHWERHGWVPVVRWVGRRDESAAGQAYGRAVDAAIEGHEAVARHWHWLGERHDIAALLEDSHALVHPSLYEGLPNVVCEALCAGRPVLASNVCDHPLLLGDGQRGFLFDPHDPQSLADALQQAWQTPAAHWSVLAANARSYAYQALTSERMVAEYEALMLPGARP